MNLLILRVLLAALPLLGLALEARSGLIYGGLAAGIFLLTATIFLLIRPALPRTVQRLVYFLVLLALTILAGRIHSVSFLIFVSLLLLSPPELFQKRRRRNGILRAAVLSSLAFFIFLSLHGLLAQGLGLGGRMRFFQHPAGSYFLGGLTLMIFSTGRPKK